MTSLRVETDTGIPMGDGIVLRADVLRPSRPGRYPAIVYRTPYDRTSFASVSLQVHALRMAASGYAVVLQDVRGRFGSPGRFEPFVNEQSDGVDTIHWAAEQPWCNGRVGTAGISYNAFAQLATATAAPEPLRAWIPGLTPFDVRTSWIRDGEALNYGFHLAWMLGGIAPVDPRTPDPGAALEAYSDPASVARRDPAEQPELAASPSARAYFQWLEADDPYPDDERVPGPGDLGAVRAPALVMAGLYDVFQPGSFELHRALGAEAGHPSHALVAGPWDHTGLPFKRRAGDRDHGPGAMLDYHELQRAWMDAHLRDREPFDDVCRVFTTGAAEWEGHEQWPPPGTTRSFELNADGSLGSPGPGGEAALTVDAGDPTPSLGGRAYPWEPLLRPGSFDQRPREARPDVLVFTSDRLDRPYRITGPVTVETVVASDAGGTDVVAMLCDVASSGASWNIADGVRRVRGRIGEPANARVSLGHAAHEFRRGHRIRVSLSAAAFPRYDVFGGPGRRVFLTGPGYSRLIVREVG